MGLKASDLDATPLCAEHHRLGPDSYHRLGERRFLALHEIDLMALRGNLRRRYGA